MTLDTPSGTIVVADSIRDLSAYRYSLFNQAWAREWGIGADMYATDGHLARLGLFIGQQEMEGIKAEYDHTILALTNLTAAVPVNYLAATLAPLVVSIDGGRCTDDSESGLAAVAGRVERLLTQEQLVESVNQSKKNFRPN